MIITIVIFNMRNANFEILRANDTTSSFFNRGHMNKLTWIADVVENIGNAISPESTGVIP